MAASRIWADLQTTKIDPRKRDTVLLYRTSALTTGSRYVL